MLKPNEAPVLIEAFVVIVVVKRCTDAQVVMLRDVSFEHQLRISVLLGDIIFGASEDVVCIVPRSVQHKCDGRVMVGVQRKAVLPLCLVTVGLHRCGVERFRHRSSRVLAALPSIALVVQAAQHELTDPAWRHIRPAVHQVILAQLRHIHKAVAVAVVVHLSVLEV